MCVGGWLVRPGPRVTKQGSDEPARWPPHAVRLLSLTHPRAPEALSLLSRERRAAAGPGPGTVRPDTEGVSTALPARVWGTSRPRVRATQGKKTRLSVPFLLHHFAPSQGDLLQSLGSNPLICQWFPRLYLQHPSLLE